MTILVKIKNEWGNDRIYPACEVGKTLVEYAGKKTFSQADLTKLRSIGYHFKIKHEGIEVI